MNLDTYITERAVSMCFQEREVGMRRWTKRVVSPSSWAHRFAGNLAPFREGTPPTSYELYSGGVVVTNNVSRCLSVFCLAPFEQSRTGLSSSTWCLIWQPCRHIISWEERTMSNWVLLYYIVTIFTKILWPWMLPIVIFSGVLSLWKSQQKIFNNNFDAAPCSKIVIIYAPILYNDHISVYSLICHHHYGEYTPQDIRVLKYDRPLTASHRVSFKIFSLVLWRADFVLLPYFESTYFLSRIWSRTVQTNFYKSLTFCRKG
jgi:hypothetical protein